MDIVELWTMASASGVVLDAKMRKNIERYCGEIKYWNQKVNLISRQDVDNIFQKHILHSLSILKYVNIPNKSAVLDVGTGGGLPGIPIKIARPDLSMVLIDSIAKKAKITQMLAAHTGLRNLEVLCGRAEEYCREGGKFQGDKGFDLIIARGVAQAKKIVEWTKPALRPNGSYALLKGGDLRKEEDDLKELYPSALIEIKDLEMAGVDFLAEKKKIMLIRL